MIEVTALARDPAARLSVRKLTGKIGAQIEGIDLSLPLDEITFDQIHAALIEHQVVFFRDQNLTEEQHRALAARFGTLSIYPAQRIAGDMSDISYIGDNADSPPKADHWHTDISWLPEPPRYAFLGAITIPAYGGDTMWASLYAAYEALSEPMRELCNSLTAMHAPSPEQLAAFRRSGKFGPDIAEKIAAIFKPVEHPLVRTHPVSGRQALYLSGFLNRIVGVTDAESDMLIRYLNSLLDDANLQVRWTWREGDFAIWDEPSTNHRALSDHYPHERMMRRCTVDGDRPFYRPN
jgi:alpha-ketoglutarate-dependent taurine dioxygenase